MPVTYDRAPQEIVDRVQRVMKLSQPALASAKVRLDVLLAYGPKDGEGIQKGPAIKVGGYPVEARIKINSLKDRVAGRGDVELVLDGDDCPGWADDRFDAVIDHALEHIEPTGEEDDAGRPRLVKRLYDVRITGFRNVAERRKDAAPEVRAFKALMDSSGQLFLPFVESLDQKLGMAPKRKAG